MRPKKEHPGQEKVFCVCFVCVCVCVFVCVQVSASRCKS